MRVGRSLIHAFFLRLCVLVSLMAVDTMYTGLRSGSFAVGSVDWLLVGRVEGCGAGFLGK